jgi:uncharacterized membrane protein YjgN (DUF898 family)
MTELEFKGNGWEYFKIWIVNIALTTLTSGLYYPWAKARNKRYFYANSSLGDKNFEYHATGKQLFLSFIISIILFIIYIIATNISPVLVPVIFLIIALLLPWVIYRSLIFNMKMSSFSNVRFRFTGKLGQSYVNFLLYPILMYTALAVVYIASTAVSSYANQILIGAVVTTLIIFSAIIYAFAFMKNKNTSYILNGSCYGDGEFKTSLKTNEFVKINLKTLLLTLAIFTIFASMFYLVIGTDTIGVVQTSFASQNPEMISDTLENIAGSIAFIYFMFIVSILFISAYLITRQRTYIYANTTLDNKINFASTLRARDFLFVTITNFIFVIISLGLATPYAKVRMARLMLKSTLIDTSISIDDYTTQKQKESSAIGEEIAEVFDVDIGVGM